MAESDASVHGGEPYNPLKEELRELREAVKRMELENERRKKEEHDRRILEETERRMREENERRERERERERRRERGGSSTYGSERSDYYRTPRREKREPRRERIEVRVEPKVTLPKFDGNGSVEVYLEWEIKVDHIFMCHQIDEEKKIALASMEFKSYAMMWWHQTTREISFGNGVHILTWEEMKRVLRERFIPPSYLRDFHNKLQRLFQGYKSIEEYHKELKVTMFRLNLHESQEATMSRFLHGLNHDIQDLLELHSYANLE